MSATLAAYRAASVLTAARRLADLRLTIARALDLRGAKRSAALYRARFELDATVWPSADFDGRDPGLRIAAGILVDYISLAMYGGAESLDALRRQVGYAPRAAEVAP